MVEPTPSSKKLTEKGLKAYQAQKYDEAIDLFSQASSDYLANDDGLSVAEVANNMSICYLKKGDPKSAFEVVAGTDEVFAKSNDVHRQAVALANQAAALEGLKQFDRAVEKYEESSRLFKEIGSFDERALVLQSLSELHLKMGHQLDAMAIMNVALDNKKKPSVLERFLKKLLQIPFRT